MDGSQTKYAQLFRADADDIIVNKIWARNGSVAVVPQSLAGCFGSGEFPMFAPNKERLYPRWIHWLTKTPGFWGQCDEKSQGTSGKNRIRPERFLDIEIPLPTLAEQRRLVARIEELAAQIQEASSLRDQATKDVGDLLVCMAHRRDLDDAAKRAAGWKQMPLRDCIRSVDDAHKVTVERSYPNLGIYSYGRGLFPKPPIEGVATSAAVLRRVKAGQFIYSRLFAFEGAYGAVTAEYDGSYVSAEYPTFECEPALVRIEFLEAYFRAPSVWKEVAVGSKGLGDRRQRVQPAQVLSHVAWIPPVPLQLQLANVRAERNSLRSLQSETAAELDTLLPAILDRAFKGELV